MTAFLTGTTLLAGCGGGGGGGLGDTSTGRIRVVDTAYLTGGDSAQLVINGGSVDGYTHYFSSGSNSSSAASPYLYIQPQNGVSFTYTINTNTNTGATNNYDVSQGQYYTAFLIGREDITATGPTDPRYLQTILPSQQAGSTSGQATLRVLNAAPDAGFSTQTSAGAITGYTTGVLNVQLSPTGAGQAATFNGVDYPTTTNSYTASSYQTLAPGTYTVGVTLAAPGTGGITTTPATFTLSAGTVYTLVVAEKVVPPSTTPPTQPTCELHLISE